MNDSGTVIEANDSLPTRPPSSSDNTIPDDATSTKGQCRCRNNFSRTWSRFILKIRSPLDTLLLVTTKHAATYPNTYVISIIFFSILMLVRASLRP